MKKLFFAAAFLVFCAFSSKAQVTSITLIDGTGSGSFGVYFSGNGTGYPGCPIDGDTRLLPFSPAGTTYTASLIPITDWNAAPAPFPAVELVDCRIDVTIAGVHYGVGGINLCDLTTSSGNPFHAPSTNTYDVIVSGTTATITIK